MAKSTTTIIEEPRMLVDTKTGEVVQVTQTVKYIQGSKQFWKVYLMDLLTVLGIVESRQMDVLIYVMENVQPSTNMFIGTYTSIQQALHVSRQTVAKIMTRLQDVGFIKKVSSGVWLVNADVMVKGDDCKKNLLISYFNSDDPLSEMSKDTKSKKKSPTPSTETVEEVDNDGDRN